MKLIKLWLSKIFGRRYNFKEVFDIMDKKERVINSIEGVYWCQWKYLRMKILKNWKMTLTLGSKKTEADYLEPRSQIISASKRKFGFVS